MFEFEYKGSVDLELMGTTDPIDETQLFQFMSTFGEIRIIRTVPNQPM
jgi:hypothetical protein